MSIYGSGGPSWVRGNHVTPTPPVMIGSSATQPATPLSVESALGEGGWAPSRTKNSTCQSGDLIVIGPKQKTDADHRDAFPSANAVRGAAFGRTSRSPHYNQVFDWDQNALQFTFLGSFEATN